MEDELEPIDGPEEEAVDAVPPAVMLQAILSADNLAEMLEESRLGGIADECVRGYDIDRESMRDWRERMERGIDLATLVKEDKTYPFKNASNVKYPLITTAALQFNARAYPAIVPAEGVVKAKVFGKDPQGQKAARADRVSEHMSWQLMSQVEEWEEATDNLLTVLPIVGTVIRKTWFDPAQQRVRVKLIDPGRFVMNDKAKSMRDAPRLTEELPLFPSEIRERVNSGAFRDVDYIDPDGEDTQKQVLFLEQHCRLDLDGDGYGEPYIVTICKETQKVARIVADFEATDVRVGQNGRVTAINRGSYYTAFSFLPSMTGGFFGTGLGALLGDISESINTIINMLIDAGHMASRGGGFIGSEFRIKGGAQQFQPGEWKMANARGGAIKDALVPITFPGPDATLFQLLGLLIEAGREVASVKDIMTGDSGGKNMTATTTLALIEQGMMVFTAAYKRIFRSLKREYKLIAGINAKTVNPQAYAMFHDVQPQMGQQGPANISPQADYNMADMDIEPVADPSSVTRMQDAAKAQIIMQLAEAGLVEKGPAVQRALEAARIADAQELVPQKNPIQDAMMQMQVEAAKADLTLKMVSVQQALADIEKTRSEVVKNMTDAAATQEKARLDRAELMLNTVKDGLEQALRGSAGGMAGTPRLPAGGGMPQAGSGRPEGIGGSVVLGGQPMVGA